MPVSRLACQTPSPRPQSTRPERAHPLHQMRPAANDDIRITQRMSPRQRVHPEAQGETNRYSPKNSVLNTAMTEASLICIIHFCHNLRNA